MPSITTWNRIEPISRTSDTEAGVSARLHDPLWLLGRQWQIGEFEGQDAGSPTTAELQIDAFEVNRYAPVPPDVSSNGQRLAPGVPYAGQRLPLEAAVECETDGRLPSGLAADAGFQFLRHLTAFGVGHAAAAFRAAFPLDAPDAPILAGRSIDGGRLAEALRRSIDSGSGAPALPSGITVDVAALPAVVAACRAWLAWFDALLTRPAENASAWRDERLEYDFSVSAGVPEGEVVLVASEYVEGHLDWHDFSVRRGVSLGGHSTRRREHRLRQSLIPAPVTFPGMPASRWWEFESAKTDLGRFEAGPEDLVRLLAVEFALIYGNDWFILPVELPIGTISRIESLVVTDSFGVRTVVPSFSRPDGPHADFRLFSLSVEGEPLAGAQDHEWMFLAPATAGTMHGEPIESVTLLRDDIANLVWAIEHVVDGVRVDDAPTREESAPLARVDGVGGADVASYRYRLSDGATRPWVPFVPVVDASNRLWLRRARLRVGDEGAAEPIAARGRVLQTGRALLIDATEVPREGVNVERCYQAARWIDGSTHVWIGRRKRPGRGEASNGLRFDRLEPVQTSEPVG